MPIAGDGASSVLSWGINALVASGHAICRLPAAPWLAMWPCLSRSSGRSAFTDPVRGSGAGLWAQRAQGTAEAKRERSSRHVPLCCAQFRSADEQTNRVGLPKLISKEQVQSLEVRGHTVALATRHDRTVCQRACQGSIAND